MYQKLLTKQQLIDICEDWRGVGRKHTHHNPNRVTGHIRKRNNGMFRAEVDIDGTGLSKDFDNERSARIFILSHKYADLDSRYRSHEL